MDNENEPVGVAPDLIEMVLKHDRDVLNFERIDGATALWQATYSVEGRPPVNLLVDNGINDIYVQILVQIDMDHVGDALGALEPYGCAGLVYLAGGLFIRVGFYAKFSTMHAVTNSLIAAALAYDAYQQRIKSA